jgi:hypothetical protein
MLSVRLLKLRHLKLRQQAWKAAFVVAHDSPRPARSLTEIHAPIERNKSYHLHESFKEPPPHSQSDAS